MRGNRVQVRVVGLAVCLGAVALGSCTSTAEQTRDPRPAPAAAAESLEPRPEEEPVEITGRLLSRESGPPLEGRRVEWRLDRRSARFETDAGRLVSEAVTAPDGAFRLPACRDEGYMSLWFRADDRWRVVLSCLWGPDVDPAFGDVAPREPDTRVFLEIRDGYGNPVQGAVASLVLSSDGAPVGHRDHSRITDAAGRCEFNGLPWENYWVDLWRDGFAPVRVATYQAQPGMHPDDVRTVVTLPDERHITGSVEVPPGARFPAFIEYSYDQGTRLDIWWVARVDEQGRFRVVAARGVPCRVRSLGGDPLTGEVEALMTDDSVTLRLRESASGE